MKRHGILDMKAIGREIRKRMEKEHLTVSELAGMLHVSPQTIYSYRKGEKLPSLQRLFWISRILNITVDGLLIKKDR